MKFAHLADVHIGGWQDPKLSKLNLDAFRRAIDICIEKHTAFVLIAGDLFNTALPSIDSIKDVASIIRKLKNKNISLYVVPGSHDFSPSGKSMIDVLEKSGLLINVMKVKENKLKFTEDKTNTKITGVLGLRLGLEKEYFKTLDFKEVEDEEGFKIFIFHCSIEEYKPKDLEKVDSINVTLFPKNFDYYAGGHVHYILKEKYDRGYLCYPGPLFPNSFKELEELKEGGFNLIEVQDNKVANIERIIVSEKEVKTYYFDANKKTPLQVEQEILNTVSDFKDKIVMLRIEGTLESGKPNDINFKEIFESFKDSYAILKNTTKLVSKEFENIDVEENIEVAESKIINEHLEKIEVKDLETYKPLINNLLLSLNKEKEEGEKVLDFENRLIEECLKSLDIEKLFGK
ncbi:hypothetical protein CL617_01435 [archaeon]|nr:hypothetical protein [archaeon]|tara:strand:+ start:11910 stop:13115 length:1206 start_codon:yes stop_codon:yes gene_type:complete